MVFLIYYCIFETHKNLITMKKLLFSSIFCVFLSASLVAQQWIPQASGFTTASRGIQYIHVVDSNVVWATAYDGTNTSNYLTEFTRTINGGQNWVPGIISGYTGYGISMIYAISGTTAWAPIFDASNGGGYILKTTNGGMTWTPQTTAQFTAPSGFPNVVHFWDANNGFCMGDPRGGYFEIYTTTNGGTNWIRVPSANIPAPLTTQEYGTTGFYSVIGNTVWFTTNLGRVFKSTDRGLTWTVVQSPITNSQCKIHFISNNVGYLRSTTSPYNLYKTTDGGASWTSVTVSGNMYPNDWCAVPGTSQSLVSVGANITSGLAGISYSIDGAQNWTLFIGTDTVQFLAVDFCSNKHGWAGSFNKSATVGGMYKYVGNAFTPDPCAGLVAVFTMNNDTANLATGGTIQFTNASLGNPTSYLWKFGDGSTSTQQNPTHTYTAVGTYFVKLIVTNASSCKDSLTLKLVVINSPGISTHKDIASVTLSPNPAGEYVVLYNIVSGTDIEIFDVTGRLVYAEKSNSSNHPIRVADFQKGLYFVKITLENGLQQTLKFFKE